MAIGRRRPAPGPTRPAEGASGAPGSPGARARSPTTPPRGEPAPLARGRAGPSPRPCRSRRGPLGGIEGSGAARRPHPAPGRRSAAATRRVTGRRIRKANTCRAFRDAPISVRFPSFGPVVPPRLAAHRPEAAGGGGAAPPGPPSDYQPEWADLFDEPRARTGRARRRSGSALTFEFGAIVWSHRLRPAIEGPCAATTAFPGCCTS